MTRPFLATALTVVALSGVALGVSHTTGFHSPDADGPAGADLTGRPSEPATLMLTVRIDARGVAVLRTTRKPQLRYRAPHSLAPLAFRWTVRDAEGRSLATGGFDPSELCLDPAHVGQPPHLQGDFLVPHETHTNVKVPDLGAAFARIEFAVVEGAESRPFGTVRREDLVIR